MNTNLINANGTLIMGDSSSGIHRSLDAGTTWEQMTPNSEVNDMLWVGDKFILVSGDNPGLMSYTVTGETFSPTTVTADGITPVEIKQMAWDGDSTIVGVGLQDTYIVSKDNGYTWTWRRLNVGPIGSFQGLEVVAWNGSQFLIVDGAAPGFAYFSSDGLNWSATAIVIDDFNMTGELENKTEMVWTGTVFIIGSIFSGSAVSSDGLTWVAQPDPDIPGGWGSGNRGSFTLVGAELWMNKTSGTTLGYPIRSTDDAETWDTPPGFTGLGGVSETPAMTHDGTKFILSTDLGIYTSLDGAAWTRQDPSVPTGKFVGNCLA